MDPNTTERQQNQVGFVTRLFRGDVSLTVTYWVFGVLVGNVAFRVILEVIELNYVEIASSRVGSWLPMGFYWLIIGYSIFMLIAIWRSAGKYQGKAVWASLARVAVVLGTLAMVGSLIIGLNEGSDTELALREEIKMMNNSLPNLIDNDTRLDHVSIQEKDVYYNYTLVNRLAVELDIPKFTSTMTANLKTAQCADVETRPLLNSGRKLVYVYRDKASKPVAKIVVDESDCL